MKKDELRILQVGNVLVSPDIITEKFCCDLDACKGECCIEGDAGAPVTLDEIMEIEDALDVVWDDLSASAQAIIDKQGVAYTDIEGDLVTSIVNGKDCVFTCYQDLKDLGDGHTIPNCCLCALERAYREGKSKFKKPISCALYPIRAKDFGNEVYGINYNKWRICKDAIKKGEELNLPFQVRVYIFCLLNLNRQNACSSSSPLQMYRKSLIFNLVPLPAPRSVRRMVP